MKYVKKIYNSMCGQVTSYITAINILYITFFHERDS
uniref:Uncharacterized protein n=1 Tax=Anguilla anguilla TaxID=7936 RepID=A0A0E9R7Y5_ANGAN